MADRRISDFPTLATAQDTDLILVGSNNETYNMQVTTLKDAVKEVAYDEATRAVTALENSVREQADAATTKANNAASSAADAAASALAAETSASAAAQSAATASTHAQTAAGNAATAGDTAATALQKATTAENEAAETTNFLSRVEQNIDLVNVALQSKVDGGFETNGYLYLTSNGEIVVGPLGPFAGGGGGGGGGGGSNADFSLTNTSGWMNKTIAQGATCTITFTWSSIENNIPTGDGSMKIMVGNAVKDMRDIEQGNISIDIAPYLSAGANSIAITVTDIYGTFRTIRATVTVVVLTLTSSFDPSVAYQGAIIFPYTPTGTVAKTVYFIMDGTQIGTATTSVSGRQQSFVIPQQTHGAHVLRCYFEAEINGQTVRSNELYYEIICLEPLNDTPIITSSFRATQWKQYETINVDYTVYNPLSLNSSVVVKVNGVTKAELTVDRTQQMFTTRADETGTFVIQVSTGTQGEDGYAAKTWTLTIIENDIDIAAETDSLVLYLDSFGRSNTEANKDTWAYNNISATLTGFNWVSDGWQRDDDNITVLRVAGNARVTIPYKIFEQDFRATGKTIEIEFATRTVLDYDTTIFSCMNGGRGISITPQVATLTSEQSEISMQYKEGDHVRLTFVCEKRSENRLLIAYINGIPSGVIQYPADDDFSQVTPANITIGSNDCTIDIYCIRVYDNDLTRSQVLENWIADTQDGALLLERYNRNNVYDEYGNIVISKLPNDLPYMIIKAVQLPQYKGDKKTVIVEYVDPLHPENSFTATGVQINVQGTSSAPYARKNYDQQYKSGFEMTASNQHADKYALASTVVPFNRFVLKADVASSEGANNVELVKLYCDISPYKTREMIANPKVRQGIYGFPIVVFWNDTENDVTSFLGKYNFNFPKRAPAPYGYSGNMESWEFQNNTSDLMVFKSDYFDETMVTDPDTGETKEAWRYDYEARFPSDEWVDYTKLQELQSFIYSTDRTAATGNALATAVTYDGVEYTTDTAAYRLAKFKNEFGKYAEVNSFIFYYIFTELFLMVDSRAKNLFIGFSGSDTDSNLNLAIDRKAVAEPYDMDTGLGTNNEGSLVFGYALEDTDHLQGGENVFNGQDSVLWNNIRDAFSTEIRQMYQTLRSGGVLSYETVEARFEAHQAKWPEAVWIEDAWFKYIDPLIAPENGKAPTGVYLPMMQGSKLEQRKWWLSNRFRYMDSKWNAGEALSKVIQLRGYAKANITVTPYADIYPTVKYASYIVQERGQHGQATTLVCPLDNVNDTEIYIYSAPQIASVGDLSGLKVGFADFSQATRLQSVKVGDSGVTYSNTNLTELYLGTNELLRSLDVRNCPALTSTIDISGCANIEHVYFDGTNIAGVSLPNGGVLKTLHLPGSITNLTIRNQPAITDFVLPSSQNISTLRLENVASTVNAYGILNSIAAGSRVRLIGFSWDMETYAAANALYDKLDTMRGLDENGGNTATAQVLGTIHIDSLTGAQLASLQERYPDITVTYDHITSNLYYYNWEGDTLLYTETVNDGGDGAYAGQPTHAATPQYTFAFAGWALTARATSANANARKTVTADRNVYAAYTLTGQTYTVRFYNGSTLLQTVNNVAYGGNATYTGVTPTHPTNPTEMQFNGWNPSPNGITGNTDCYAQWLDTSSAMLKYLKRNMTEWESDTATTVGQYAFYNMTTLTSVETTATTIGQYAFSNCSNLATVDLAKTTGQVSIGANAFQGCNKITAIIIRSTTAVATAQSNSLPSAPFVAGDGAIYVPSSLVSSYKSTSPWSTYASRIFAIDDYPVTNFDTIKDTWAEIIAAGDNGTYASKYSVGDTKTLTYGSTSVVMELVAKDTDIKANSADTAHMTWLVKNFKTSHRMNSTGTTAGGWPSTEMLSWLEGNEVFGAFPSELKTAIVSVQKTYYDNDDTSTKTTNNTIWIPSSREVCLTGTYLKESSGVQYSGVFSNDASRIKYDAQGSASGWWLRSAYSGALFVDVGINGNGYNYGANTSFGVVFGFCI